RVGPHRGRPAQGSRHACQMRRGPVDPRRAHLRRGHSPPAYRGRSLLRSAYPLSLSFPVLLAVDMVVVLCLCVQFTLAAYYFYLLFWLPEAPHDQATPPLPAELPLVLVQIPIYNEPAVVERAVVAAGALDWP